MDYFYEKHFLNTKKQKQNKKKNKKKKTEFSSVN